MYEIKRNIFCIFILFCRFVLFCIEFHKIQIKWLIFKTIFQYLVKINNKIFLIKKKKKKKLTHSKNNLFDIPLNLIISLSKTIKISKNIVIALSWPNFRNEMVSRVVHAKGVSLAIGAAPEILSKNVF